MHSDNTSTVGAIHSTFAADESMAELVEMFVEEIPARIETLLQAFQAEDMELLHRTAHQLKGAFGSYGFDVATEPARRLEHSVLNEPANRDAISHQLDHLIGLCHRMTAMP